MDLGLGIPLGVFLYPRLRVRNTPRGYFYTLDLGLGIPLGGIFLGGKGGGGGGL
jgi:hypothetical protein